MAKSADLVTVILNSYNQAEYLPDAIESVLSQSTPLELLITDNGSTDESQDVARRYAQDERVTLVLHPDNAPVSIRLNDAVSRAKGRYVSFLYSDDYFLPGKLELQLRLIDEHPEAGVVYGPSLHENVVTGERWVRPTVAVRGGGLTELLETRSPGRPPDMSSPLSRRQCFLDFPFDESLFTEGEAIYLHVATKYRFWYDERPTVVLRDHAENAGKAIKRNESMALASVRRLYVYDYLDERERWVVRRYEADLLASFGWQAARLLPDAKWALSRLRQACRIDPRQALNPRVVAGLILALLPAWLRGGLNQVGHRARGSAGHTTYLDDYPGLRDGPET